MLKNLTRATVFGLLLAFLLAPATTTAAPAPDSSTVAAAPAGKVAVAAAPTSAPVAVSTPAAKAPAAAPAAKAPLPAVDPSDPGAMIKYIISAFKTGKWAWGIGLILMLLTFLFNKLIKSRIPPKVLPWVAIGLGVATNIAMSFATGLKWYQALSNGLSMGLAAVGGWEAVGKLFKKPKTA